MAQTKVEVWQVLIDYTCDKCGIGKMRPTGVGLMSSPPQYPHICNNCGEEQIFRKVKYPYIGHVDVEGNEV